MAMDTHENAYSQYRLPGSGVLCCQFGILKYKTLSTEIYLNLENVICKLVLFQTIIGHDVLGIAIVQLLCCRSTVYQTFTEITGFNYISVL